MYKYDLPYYDVSIKATEKKCIHLKNNSKNIFFPNNR